MAIACPVLGTCPNPPAFAILFTRYDYFDADARPATKTRAGLIDASGRYRIELCEGWTGCSDGTAVHRLQQQDVRWPACRPSPRSTGTPSGHSCRSSGVSANWRTWVGGRRLQEGQPRRRHPQERLQTRRAAPAATLMLCEDSKDACKGTVVGRTASTCKQRSPPSWTVKPAEGDGPPVLQHREPRQAVRVPPGT